MTVQYDDDATIGTISVLNKGNAIEFKFLPIEGKPIYNADYRLLVNEIKVLFPGWIEIVSYY